MNKLITNNHLTLNIENMLQIQRVQPFTKLVDIYCQT